MTGRGSLLLAFWRSESEKRSCDEFIMEERRIIKAGKSGDNGILGMKVDNPLRRTSLEMTGDLSKIHGMGS